MKSNAQVIAHISKNALNKQKAFFAAQDIYDNVNHELKQALVLQKKAKNELKELVILNELKGDLNDSKAQRADAIQLLKEGCSENGQFVLKLDNDYGLFRAEENVLMLEDEIVTAKKKFKEAIDAMEITAKVNTLTDMLNDAQEERTEALQQFRSSTEKNGQIVVGFKVDGDKVEPIVESESKLVAV